MCRLGYTERNINAYITMHFICASFLPLLTTPSTLHRHVYRTQLRLEFSEQEIAHCLLTRKGVVHSYVVQAQEGGPVTDLCSFYFLNSSVINNPLHSSLGAVYSFYNIAKTVPLSSLIQDLLVLARNEGADVFNALNVMENETIFEALQFGAGDGMLQYYLYNWKCRPMVHTEIGLVLL